MIHFSSLLRLSLVLGLLLSLSGPCFAQATYAVTITPDTSVANQIEASGTYQTPNGITLTQVVVWCFPSQGGLMPPQAAAMTITAAVNNNGSWKLDGAKANPIKTRVYGVQYAIYAQATFSDQTVIGSSFILSQVSGNAPLGLLCN
jgi:hypothetical protein